jgi:23S rRNA (uracil-5-)-methyltransferase RumA
MAEPLCPYFGHCGGCSLQDVDRDEQLLQKKERLREAVGIEDIQVFSGGEYHYRNRMDFVFHAEGLGLREQGAFYKFVDIPQCAISNAELNELLAEVRDFFQGVFYFDVRRRFGAFCYAVIRTPSGGSSVSIVLNKKDKKLDRAVEKIKEYAKITRARNVLVTYVPHNRNVSISEDYEVIKGSDRLSEDYLGHTFFFPTQGFFQVNHEIASQVHTYCSGLLSFYDTRDAYLLDLYGGVGSFAVLNAPLFHKVGILENYPPAVELAEHNLKENGIQNGETICLDARHLSRFQSQAPLYIIMDPPRSGINPKTLKTLASDLEYEAMLYVSCNPKLLAKDLQELDRYQVKSAALFDMFPQTPHMEAVVELIKK